MPQDGFSVDEGGYDFGKVRSPGPIAGFVQGAGEVYSLSSSCPFAFRWKSRFKGDSLTPVIPEVWRCWKNFSNPARVS